MSPRCVRTEVGDQSDEAAAFLVGRLVCLPQHADFVVVFEDSHVGVLAAKAAGMYCVAVRNPKARTEQDLSAADQVLESFEQLNTFNVAALRAH